MAKLIKQDTRRNELWRYEGFWRFTRKQLKEAPTCDYCGLSYVHMTLVAYRGDTQKTYYQLCLECYEGNE